MFYSWRTVIQQRGTAGAPGGKKAIMGETQIEVEADLTRSTKQIKRTTQFEYPIAATLTREEVCACIEDTGVLPNVITASIEDALFVANALLVAGIPAIEISMNAAEALEIVSHLVKHAPMMIVGGGSVRNAEMAGKCIDAGAKFVATDGLVTGGVERAAKNKTAIIAGGLTLTEVISAWDTGADFVKVVPCYAVGGPSYIQTLKDSIPQARLIAAGGVNQLTALNYIKAGATALGVGIELIPTEAIALRQSRRIQELARRFLTAVDTGRD
jgi:2-dehydro-3-deoxyphosphogluconate aldolase/(4S)-4-hydroxy-2-oxoglutarate aldolase